MTWTVFYEWCLGKRMLSGKKKDVRENWNVFLIQKHAFVICCCTSVPSHLTLQKKWRISSGRLMYVRMFLLREEPKKKDSWQSESGFHKIILYFGIKLGLLNKQRCFSPPKRCTQWLPSNNKFSMCMNCCKLADLFQMGSVVW